MVLVHEETDLVIGSKREIEKIKKKLGDNPHKCQKLTKHLNSKYKHQLEQIWVTYKTNMIMQANKVITKNKLIESTEYKMKGMASIRKDYPPPGMVMENQFPWRSTRKS